MGRNGGEASSPPLSLTLTFRGREQRAPFPSPPPRLPSCRFCTLGRLGSSLPLALQADNEERASRSAACEPRICCCIDPSTLR